MEEWQKAQGSKLEAVNRLAHQVVGHMQEKYGKPFQVSILKEGGFVSEEVKVRVYPHGDEPRRNTAVVYVRGSEDAFQDNYFGVQVRDEYTRYVQQLLDRVVPGSMVFCSGFMESYFDERLGAGKSLADANELGQSLTGLLYIYFESDGKAAARHASLVKSALEGEDTPALVKVIALKPGLLANVGDENFDDVLSLYKDTHGERCEGIFDFYTARHRANDENAKESGVPS